MNVKKITTIAILSAVSFCVSIVAFPIIPGVSFLKLDLSDTILSVVAVLFGFKSFILSAILKGFLLYLKGADIIGVISNIFAALLFVGGYYFTYKKSKKFILPAINAILSLTIGMSLFNYLIFLPLYVSLFNLNFGPLDTLIITAILPFNLIKGVILSIINAMMLPKIKRLSK